MPPLEPGTLYPNQVEAVNNLEQSLRRNRPRALIQMATGSGKTKAAITAIYRLIKFGGARRNSIMVSSRTYVLFGPPELTIPDTDASGVMLKTGRGDRARC
jgi:superfamily II DNA or RNA helicase